MNHNKLHSLIQEDIDTTAITTKTETDKLIEAMNESSKSGEDSVQYAKVVSGLVKDVIEEKVDIGSSSTSSNDTSSSDDGSNSDTGSDEFDMGDTDFADDASGDSDASDGLDDLSAQDDATDEDKDSPVKPPEDKDKDDKKDDKKSSTAQESFRSIRIDIPRQLRRRKLATELIDDISGAIMSDEASQHRTDRVFLNEEPIGHKLVNWAGNKIANSFVWLKNMGIQYGPSALKFLGETIVTIATETARLTITGAEKLRRFAHKKLNSFESLQKEIQSLQQKLHHFVQDNPKTKPEGSYTNDKYIPMLKIGSSTKVLANMESMHKFTDSTIMGVSKLLDGEVQKCLNLTV